MTSAFFSHSYAYIRKLSILEQFDVGEDELRKWSIKGTKRAFMSV